MKNCDSGKLYLIATPIGNLEDMTMRGLRILGEVDAIYAEDTRRTRKLLSHFELHTSLHSYHSHNEHFKTEELLNRVRNGEKIAVVSDAGTPVIADPGFLLVRDAAAENVPLEVVPGVSALTFAAAGAGLPVDRFAFYGFPPVKSGKRGKFFEQIKSEDKTVFFFESPHRIGKALDNIVEHVGTETPVAIIREATKVHEEILRGSAGELASAHAGRKWKGECVIGVYPRNV